MKNSIYISLFVLIIGSGSIFAQESDCFPVDRSQAEWSGAVSVEDQESSTIKIKQINPNPASNNTVIDILLEQPSDITLTAYDLAGKKVSDIYNKFVNTLEYSIEWNTKDNEGKSLPSGSYYIELKVKEGETFTKKLIISR